MGRIDRINEQVKREISLMLQRDIQDPRLEFVSITLADVSLDLRNARIYYSVLLNSHSLEEVQNGFHSARGLIRRLLGQRMKMRFTPELMFSLDESISHSAKIEDLLQEIHHEHPENYSGDQEQ
ncbi:MAG TPA: 30S ribosome-binding factor RbfA [Candidatus Omnitrophota bacterium]|nr:30S ribosome-binding factor RbfA [Candidatus Omnitrophota bacterium]HPN88026.1 30S ribosome-binding factor RbfA [Candidatus Omnitrophota bacterium]